MGGAADRAGPGLADGRADQESRRVRLRPAADPVDRGARRKPVHRREADRVRDRAPRRGRGAARAPEDTDRRRDRRRAGRGDERSDAVDRASARARPAVRAARRQPEPPPLRMRRSRRRPPTLRARIRPQCRHRLPPRCSTRRRSPRHWAPTCPRAKPPNGSRSRRGRSSPASRRAASSTRCPTLDDETAEKMAQRLSERAEGTITAEDVKNSPTIEALATIVRELPRVR